MSEPKRPDPSFWVGRNVLVTGHTGFKGAWLSLWLDALGARVTGLSDAVPTEPSLFELARVQSTVHDARVAGPSGTNVSVGGATNWSVTAIAMSASEKRSPTRCSP